MPAHHLLFHTDNGNAYLYDTPSSSVHPWPAPLSAEFATSLYAATDEQLDRLVASVYPEESRRKGLLFHLRLWRTRAGAFRTPRLPVRLSLERLTDAPADRRGPAWMSDLVLIASEACNLRCGYCSYSSCYPSYRSHSGKLMGWQVARKAIDWFYLYNDAPRSRSYPDRNLNIVFYGGEPFLNFELIRRAVRYAQRRKRDHYGLVLSVSTNLTFLTEEHLAFLREHDVFITVSLDGPPDEHDRYRRFPDGRPTSETVLANLRKIRAFDEDYYFGRVRILPTLNGSSNAAAIYDFFERSKADLPPFQMVNLLKDLHFSDFHRAHPYDRARFEKALAGVLALYKHRKLDGAQFRKGDFFYHLVEESLNNVFQRLHSYGTTLPTWYTGACLPGRKLAVDPDGTFHICERINHRFPIGNVAVGLDEERALRVVDQYFASLPDCDQCWARNLCTICYAAVCEEGGFDFARRCDAAINSQKANLKLLFTILEKRHDAFRSKDRLIAGTASPLRSGMSPRSPEADTR